MSIALLLALIAQAPDDLLTVAEKSGYKATARHAEVVALCERLAKASPEVRLIEMGRSGEGRSIPLMVVADPPLSTPEEARASGKLVVFLFANIHAGEVCGKEALPILVRELTAVPHHPLLQNLVLLVAPIYNADGNERVSKDNRPGQVGPEDGMGRRSNSAGLDLNRDYMKLEAPETRALIRLLNTWDPELTLDLHTTNGSHHRYTLTYDGPKSPAGNRGVLTFSREVMFPEVDELFEKRSGFLAYYYGNFESDHTRWTSFPATPRFGTTYVGLRNRLSILSEAYSYASFKDRITATRDFCLASLEFADDRRNAIRKVLGEARQATIAAGLDPKATDVASIRSKAAAFPGKEVVFGFVEKVEDGKTVATAEPRDYDCVVEHNFVSTLDVPRPYAYLIPPGFDKAIDVLKAHGIAVETLDKPTTLEVQVDKIDAFTRANRAFEKHRTLDVTATTPRTETRTPPAGTTLIRTGQPLGSLLIYLVEARSDDGLVTWNYLDDAIVVGQDYPIVKLPRPAAVGNLR